MCHLTYVGTRKLNENTFKWVFHAMQYQAVLCLYCNRNYNVILKGILNNKQSHTPSHRQTLSVGGTRALAYTWSDNKNLVSIASLEL